MDSLRTIQPGLNEAQLPQAAFKFEDGVWNKADSRETYVAAIQAKIRQLQEAVNQQQLAKQNNAALNSMNGVGTMQQALRNVNSSPAMANLGLGTPGST
jgi:hypothetical protein